MEKSNITIGVAATRRMVFSKSEAKRYKDLLLQAIANYDANIIDIDDINVEGLLFDDEDASRVINKFKSHKIDGIFIPHCNFGTEHLAAKVAKAMNKPVLLWGPRDDAPLPNGSRTRDTQCGLFATGKILRRLNTPFSYIVNSRLEDKQFKNGFRNFIRVCNIVKTFRKIKILQISTRPDAFWTMMYNEGELLEKFGIEVFPITFPDIELTVNRILKERTVDFLDTKKRAKAVNSIEFDENAFDIILALKSAMKEFCINNGCNAVAIQCWNAMQKSMGITPCISNGLLTDEGIPVVCETDIHGKAAVVLYEACKYIDGLSADPADPSEEEIMRKIIKG